MINHYSRADRAFSLAAGYYDADERANLVARWTRQANLDHLAQVFRTGDVVLELGCGTGTEALALTKRGVDVVATDAAQGMVDVLRAKLADRIPQNGAGRITPLVMPAGDLSLLLDSYGYEHFDGAYSSFGALNCEPQLLGVATGLGAVVRPGGRVVISLLGRTCLWEVLWYLLHADVRRAFRRWRGQDIATVRAGWTTERVAVYYWSLRQIEDAFAPYFQVTEVSALPWILPPQYLAGLLTGRRIFHVMAALERVTAPRWPAYHLGDHLRVTMLRKSGAAA